MHKIQAKLYKAYGIVARVLGSDHDIYRSASVTDPINGSTWIDTKKVSFSMDDKYSNTPGQGFNEWKCFVDGRLENLFNIQQGDFIKSPETGETWMVSSAEEMLPLKAIRLKDTVTVYRSGYGNSGNGFGPGDTEVATSVPCNINDGTPSGGSLGYIPAGNYQQESRQVAVVWLHDPQLEIHERDAIVDQTGQRYQVLSNVITPIGNKMVVKAYEAS